MNKLKAMDAYLKVKNFAEGRRKEFLMFRLVLKFSDEEFVGDVYGYEQILDVLEAANYPGLDRVEYKELFETQFKTL